MARNVVDNVPATGDAAITYNEDGSATVKFSNDFFFKAQKQWETSIIGYFIGGSFAFKFIVNKLRDFGKTGA